MKFAYLLATDPKSVGDWARQLITDLNRYPDPGGEFPGPYTNDAAAASAGIPVGSSYMDTAGIYRRRLT